MQQLLFENFKIFNEQVQIDLAPITLFTGKNSAGKSTIIKGLLLLSDFMNADVQLTINLNSRNSIKHRLNVWENVKNWYSQSQTVSFGYSQNDLNFYFSFSAASDESGALLDLFVMEAPEINDYLALKRRSEFILDLTVSQSFLNYLIGKRLRNSADHDYESQIAVLKKNLQSIRKKKDKASQQELIGLITDEKSTEKQLTIFQEHQKKSEVTKNEREIIYNPQIDVEDETFTSYQLPNIIRSALRRYMVEDSKKGGKHEMESRKQMDLISFRFADAFKFRSQFAVYHLSPGRIKQARLYYLYEGNSEFHDLINWYGKHAIRAGEEHRFLLYWMKELGIGEDLKVKTIEGEAATVKIELVGSGQYVDLADLGYGAGQVLSILLAIVKVQSDFEDLDLRSSHLKRNTILMIEEAESNLHPLLQSKLAEMFYEASKLFKIQFILETHSEYLIRKFQVLIASQAKIAEKSVVSEDILIYYVDSVENKNVINKITILEDGSLSDRFGEGFFDEADKQAMELFKAQNSKN
jgi:predicted ATPase